MGFLVLGLTIPTVWSHKSGKHDINQFLGYSIVVMETMAVILSVAQLVTFVISKSKAETPVDLLRGAALLWLSNVLVFALWYWRIDAGGPHRRDTRPGHPCGDFLFPQMTIQPEDPMWEPNWSPHFVDYLFLAFNTSTALSPTDVPVFSPRAKLLMMVQAMISLTLIVIVAARAVNVL